MGGLPSGRELIGWKGPGWTAGTITAMICRLLLFDLGG